MYVIGDLARPAHIMQLAFTLDTFTKRAFSPLMKTGAFTMWMITQQPFACICLCTGFETVIGQTPEAPK